MPGVGRQDYSVPCSDPMLAGIGNYRNPFPLLHGNCQGVGKHPDYPPFQNPRVEGELVPAFGKVQPPDVLPGIQAGGCQNLFSAQDDIACYTNILDQRQGRSEIEGGEDA